jgi:hypothetical protein
VAIVVSGVDRGAFHRQRAERRYFGATSVIMGHSTNFCVGSAGEGASWRMISF